MTKTEPTNEPETRLCGNCCNYMPAPGDMPVCIAAQFIDESMMPIVTRTTGAAYGSANEDATLCPLWNTKEVAVVVHVPWTDLEKAYVRGPANLFDADEILSAGINRTLNPPLYVPAWNRVRLEVERERTRKSKDSDGSNNKQ